jgi:rootletin
MEAFKTEIEAQLQQGALRERKLENDKQILAAKVSDLKIEYSNLEHNLAEKTKEVVLAKKTEEQMKHEVTELSKFIKEYTVTKERDSQELKLQISNLQAEIAFLKNEHEKQTILIKDDSGKEKKAKEALVDQLRDTIDKCDTQIQTLLNEKSSLENLLKKSEAEVKDKTSLIETLENTIRGKENLAKTQLEAYNSNLDKERYHSKSLVEEINSLKLEIEKRNKECSNLQAKVDSLITMEREKEGLLEESKRTSSRLLKVDSERVELQTKLDKQQALLTESKTRLIAATQDSMTAKAEVRKMELEFVSIQGELERVNKLLEMAEKSMLDSDRQNNELIKQNGQLQDQCQRFHGLLDNSERELSRLTSQSNEHSSQTLVFENRQLKSQLESANTEISTLRATLVANSPRGRINGLSQGSSGDGWSQSGAGGDLEAKRLAGQLAEADAALARLAEQLKRKTEEAEAFKKKAAVLEETAEELIDDFKANEELQRKLKVASSEAKSLSKELEAAKKTNDDDKKELKKRIDHNKKLTEAYEKQLAEVKRLEEVQKALSTELSSVKSQLSIQKPGQK